MPARKSKAAPAVLEDLDLALLTPEQFEAMTKANYHHPESRLILMLFLQANYLWQLARKLQNKSSGIDKIDWALIEKNTAAMLCDTLSKLLTGVKPEPWQLPPVKAPEPPKPRKRKPRLACGCAHHSDAAGVVEACILGQEQGGDETWTGF
ncbi:MAG: hypothetical protein K2W95_32450 [Candidatus Obscuribacterales bacterium]|nr:hypothetical protein [Candidatus Obscuribacterales bacterium]